MLHIVLAVFLASYPSTLSDLSIWPVLCVADDICYNRFNDPPPPIEGPGQVALSWAKRKNCPGGQEQAGTGSGGGIPAVRFLPPQQVSRVASCYENIRFHTFAYKFCSVFFEMNKIEKSQKNLQFTNFFRFLFSSQLKTVRRQNS